MFSLNLFCSLGICGALFAFANEIGTALSPNPDVGVYIRLLAPVIPIMYLDTAVDCMLKGMDEQLSVMRYNVVDAALSMALVYILLPIMGIKGYILVICLSEVFNFSLSLGRLIKVTKFELDLTERVVKPILCIAISVLATKIMSHAGLFSDATVLLGACAPDMLPALHAAIPGFFAIGTVTDGGGLVCNGESLDGLRGFDHFEAACGTGVGKGEGA